jgi:hypothetical protein
MGPPATAAPSAKQRPPMKGSVTKAGPPAIVDQSKDAALPASIQGTLDSQASVAPVPLAVKSGPAVGAIPPRLTTEDAAGVRQEPEPCTEALPQQDTTPECAREQQASSPSHQPEPTPTSAAGVAALGILATTEGKKPSELLVRIAKRKAAPKRPQDPPSVKPEDDDVDLPSYETMCGTGAAGSGEKAATPATTVQRVQQPPVPKAQARSKSNSLDKEVREPSPSQPPPGD